MDFSIPPHATVQRFRDLEAGSLFVVAFKEGQKGMGPDDAFTSVEIDGTMTTITLGWFRKKNEFLAKAMHLPDVDITVPLRPKGRVVIVEVP